MNRNFYLLELVWVQNEMYEMSLRLFKEPNQIRREALYYLISIANTSLRV